MADAIASLGQGAMKYLSAIQSNKNARAQNATNDKWGPLLALNHSKGAANINVPKASFADIMGPAIQSGVNSMASGGGGGVGGANPMMMAGDQGEAMGMGGGMMMAAGGGGVPRYSGKVPGIANVPGDSPMNDTKMIGASPGEVVLPRTIAQEGMKGNHWKVAQYLHDVKKHGPGPMPINKSAQPGPGKAKSSSMNPWEAMAAGGKVGC